MPLNTEMIGAQTPSIAHNVDARWIMAYAAAIRDLNPAYRDTSVGSSMAEPMGALTAHPLFSVCLEWPAILKSRELPGFETNSTAERSRGVHAAHDLHIYQPLVAGEVYETQATITDLQQIKPGAAQTLRLDTRNRHGELVCRTWQLTISRQVSVVEADERFLVDQAVKADFVPPVSPIKAPGDEVNKHYVMVVEAGAAHIYTECARIWNPIHTDKAFALAAGLPNIILHGTATLAMAVTRLVNEFLQGQPERVNRIGGRFTGMVLMPTLLSLDVLWQSASYIGFAITDEQGSLVFSGGFIGYA
ncbi:MAG: acyl dehydratase [Candidatus Paceibacteria bacterium]|jgi:acyl dehydratase